MKEVIVNLEKVLNTYVKSLIITMILSTVGLLVTSKNLFFKINWLFIPLALFVIVLHEGLHAIGFIVIGKLPPGKVKFGFHKEYKVPYCSAEGIISRFGYLSALLLPNIVLNGIAAMGLLFTENLFWILFVSWLVASGSGDYYMFSLIYKYNNNTYFMDHPTEPGFFVIDN